MNAIIALNPGQMAEAQKTTISWAEQKLAAARKESDDADAVFQSLNAARLNTRHATHLQDQAARRVKFYEKVKAALEAGYYIIPPFDIQLFAVRTDRSTVDEIRSEYVSTNREQKARALPLGAGRYANPVPVVSAVGIEKRPAYGDPSKTRDATIYAATDWRDEIDLPVRAMKPTIIDAVGKALEQRIFDALGIAPAYRAADPIIAGQIKRPDGKGVLTFFVAWWLDDSDL